MNESMKHLRRARVLGWVAVVALISGCASQAPAPVRHSTSPPPESATSRPSTVAPVQQIHVVRPGDTLMGISRLYGRNINDLVVWNNLIDPNRLRVGQEVRVSAPGGPVGTTPPESVAIATPVPVQPVSPGGMGDAPVVYEPRGGRQPYSDQAWAAVRPGMMQEETIIEPPLQPAPVPTPTPPAVADTPWLWPAGGPIVAGFNEATNKGIDIGGSPGDPVIAARSGQVVYSGSGLRGYGKLVIIKHDDDYLTAYAHNQNLLVQEGESIAKGQRIAELGSTDADRPKLHFEIRRQGRPVDPMRYLPPR